jgi:hypothetical protein
MKTWSACHQCLQHHTSVLLGVPSLTSHQMQIRDHALLLQGFGLSNPRGAERWSATTRTTMHEGNEKGRKQQHIIPAANRRSPADTAAAATTALNKSTCPARTKHRAAQNIVGTSDRKQKGFSIHGRQKQRTAAGNIKGLAHLCGSHIIKTWRGLFSVKVA